MWFSYLLNGISDYSLLQSSSLSGNHQHPRTDGNVSNIYYIPDGADSNKTDSKIRDNNLNSPGSVKSSHLYKCSTPLADDMQYEIVRDTLKKKTTQPLSSGPTSISADSSVHVVQHSAQED